MKKRVILVGIGGASCAGKTTLAETLRSVIPECSILHQDDYFAASKTIPIHPAFNIPDVYDAEYTIDWPRFRAAVAQLKAESPSSGNPPKLGGSELGLDSSAGESSSFTLSDKFKSEWRDRFRQVEKEWLAKGVKIEWKITEGFVLFYDMEVVNNLDIKIFLRASEPVLKQRKVGRSYPTEDGGTWIEPPGYWELAAYPGYIRAHSHLFYEGDVEVGNLSQRAKALGIVLFNGEGTEENLSFEGVFRETASAILLRSQPANSELWTSSACGGTKDGGGV